MTVQTDPTPATPTARRRWWIVAGVTLAALIVAAGSYLALRTPDPLANDPSGAQACHDLTDWIRGDVKDPDTGKAMDKAYVAVALGAEAKRSTTTAIQAAAGQDILDGSTGALLAANGAPHMQFADLPSLHAACAAAGVKMPPYRVPA